jgi:hypothetical protein
MRYARFAPDAALETAPRIEEIVRSDEVDRPITG